MSNPRSDRELVIHRIIDLPADSLYRCWTEPELLKQWFAPRPWSTIAASLDVRPGGTSAVTMCSPEGEEFPNRGVYLEVVPNKRLVLTDAYTEAWVPAAEPFITIDLTFEDMGDGKTNYTARVMHWTAAACEKHENMGFYAGWNQALDQLIETAKSQSNLK